MSGLEQPIFTDCTNCGSVDHRDYACPCGCHIAKTVAIEYGANPGAKHGHVTGKIAETDRWCEVCDGEYAAVWAHLDPRDYTPEIAMPAGGVNLAICDLCQRDLLPWTSDLAPVVR